ncbi:MAG: hypothetical protein JO262_20755 [Solirubrobacterales bacterium]|nr:hypothetical protein [Solirubrobacterales bacterium]
MPITPVSGTSLVLTAPSSTSPGGQISVQTPGITIAGVTVGQGQLNWNLPAGNKGDEKTVFSTGMVNGEKLFGFPISGSAEIRIGWDATNNLRYFKFLGNLALPSIFKNGPEQGAGGLTASVGLRVDAAGVHADNVKAVISNAYIGTLQIKNLCLSYVGAGSTTTPCSPPLYGSQQFLTCTNPGNVARWDGSAEIVIPTAARPVVGVYAGVQNGMFSYAGGQVTNLGNSVPIAQGVYLESVALAVCVTPPPIAFKGGAGINVGPTVNGVTPVTIRGSLQYTDSRPWVLEARGNVQVFGRPVADAFLRYKSDNTIDFGFNLNLDFKIASLSGSVNGWIEARNPLRFNVLGTGRVCLASVACSSGEVAASSVGLAGCFTLLDFAYPVIVKNSDWTWWAFWRVHTEIHHKRIRGGVGVRWANNAVSLMGDSCDVGPYQATRSARDAATGGFKLVVASGTPVLALQVHGRTRAPRVELIAPDGRRYASPHAAAVIQPGREVFAEDRLNATTAVDIIRPAGGVWTIRPLGASVLTSIRRASVDPPSAIVAGVSPARFSHVLTYSYQPDPQHRTRFVERGANYERELGPALGTPCQGTENQQPRPLCGEIRFTPAPGPGGTRRIYAITTENGEITEDRLVATYMAPREPEPSRVPKLSVQRVGSNVTISWGASQAPVAAARPMDYDIDVNISDGRRLLDVARGFTHHVTIPNVDAGLGVTVRVAGVRDDDTQGAARTVILAPGHAKAT